MSDYQEFLHQKALVFKSTGIKINDADINQFLFPFQRDLTRWAVRKGRAAIFADTGLGKTYMALEWARLLGQKTLILAPLSVARQTVKLARNIGVTVDYVRDQSEVKGNLSITNYEMMDHFIPDDFGAVVLDESSLLKGLNSKTRQKLFDMFCRTPYRLCCTATPAPNDIAEIANHAEFLGIMPRAEMLASFFVHDDEGWRLRGHAEKPFFRWMASWGMSVKKPSDLGYDDDGFILPSLTVRPHFVTTDYKPENQLMFTGLKGIQDRSGVRKGTIEAKVQAIVDMVNNTDGQWIVWCGLNDESKALTKAISDAREIEGSDDLEYKISTIEAFQDSQFKALVTKSRIAGYGLNLQNCHQMAFCGLNDSWEGYYQAVRRCWRFGQKSPVKVHIVLADVEEEIYRNVMAKEAEAERMSHSLIENVREFEREEMAEAQVETYEYKTAEMRGDGWWAMLGDSVDRLKEVESDSIDLSCYSPPFESLYTYSPTERDLGNSKTSQEFFGHYAFIIRELLRVTKPGRNTAVHTADVPAMLGKDGYIGLKDFPGEVIRAHEREGWIYHGRVTIDKNPQAQAIRTHSKALLFVQMNKDSSWSRPALGDYILIFRKPGDNAVPITPVKNGEIDNELWIKWASPIWTGIHESDTLQFRSARDCKDDRHICPLQLGTIERCIKLWSNPGETVLTPFGGIGSEAYQALKFGRKAIAIELKESYFKVMVKNLASAQQEVGRVDLFAHAGMKL